MNNIESWNIVTDHEVCVSFEDKEGWWKASLRFDGCINIWKYSNVPFTERDDGEGSQLIDYIHICSITDFISMLEFFKNEMLNRNFSV